MAVKKFCLMTEGRSGSTSLMESLESCEDIAVPNKNIKCPDNELVHLRFFRKYCKQYTRIMHQDINSSNELIDAFFRLNDTERYYYAGFKSMPNRHPDFQEFTSRQDIRFITLKRRDTVSTIASFMQALQKGTWRRHGEKWDEIWTFDPAVDGDNVRSNLGYVFESHRLLAGINNAITLAYEDLCNPDYQSAELNEFFMRPIRIKDPKPPTVASSYVSNWDEFKEFVEENWNALEKAGINSFKLPPVEPIPIPRSRSRRSPDTPHQQADNVAGANADFLMKVDTVKTYCQFIGSPLSGSNLIMALLNAHPDIAIGHESGILPRLEQSADLNGVVPTLLESITRFFRDGNANGTPDLTVPNQWQGRYRQLQVIGDDAAMTASLGFRKNPAQLEKLAGSTGLQLRFIHVYRNPFDNIATLGLGGVGSVDKATSLYLSTLEGVNAVCKSAGNDNVYDLCMESFIGNPRQYLQDLCRFLQVECDEQYLQDCLQIVFKDLPQSRKQIAWNTEQISRIQSTLGQYPMLEGYFRQQESAGVIRKSARGKRIIYAWELGMDLGHIMPFLPLALQLRELGYEVIFAIRDLQYAETVIGRLGFQVMQAPLWLATPRNLKGAPLNYAEIILRYGFLTAPGLKGLVKCWRALFQYTSADLVIADHAPAALLAARTLDLKRVTIGTGFCAPPPVSPLPNMRPWLKVPEKRLISSDAFALKNANSVIADLGGKPMKMLADLFQVNSQFLCTFPELDHYPNRARTRYWGPNYNIDEGAEIVWPKGEGHTVFVYLKMTYKDYERVLRVLHKLDIRVIAYVPGVSDDIIRKYGSDSMIISREPVKLRTIVKTCRLALCHAGAGTVAAMLLNGVPLLLLPTQLEQLLVARRIEQMGCGLFINNEKKAEKPDYKGIINRLLDDNSCLTSARAFATKYATFRPEAQYRAMASVVDGLLVTRGDLRVSPD